MILRHCPNGMLRKPQFNQFHSCNFKISFNKKKLNELNEEIVISGRDNISGTKTNIEAETGVLPNCSPNEFFCLMLKLMRGLGDDDISILMDFINQKTEENDSYSKNFLKVYLQGPFPGLSIQIEYYNNSKKEKKQKILKANSILTILMKKKKRLKKFPDQKLMIQTRITLNLLN